MLRIDSPGGTVSGTGDLAEAISQADALELILVAGRVHALPDEYSAEIAGFRLGRAPQARQVPSQIALGAADFDTEGAVVELDPACDHGGSVGLGGEFRVAHVPSIALPGRFARGHR